MLSLIMHNLVKITAIIALGPAFAVAQTAITVDVGSTLQEIDGFGVSEAFGHASQFPKKRVLTTSSIPQLVPA
jgi:O-glycosyl hydrolase